LDWYCLANIDQNTGGNAMKKNAMQIHVQSAFITRSRRYKTLLQRYLHWVFARFAIPIHSINLRMGEKALNDKLVTNCRLQIQLKTGNSVVIEQNHLRPLLAVKRTVRAAFEALEILCAQLNLARAPARALAYLPARAQASECRVKPL
jgi:hypothetical protein